MKEEDKLKAMLDTSDVENDKAEMKTMHKKMNRRIMMLMVKVIVVIAIILGVGYYGTSAIMNAINYKPNELSFKKSDIEDNDLLQNDPTQIMTRSYVRMMSPNMDIGFSYDGFQSKGFGNYESAVVVVENGFKSNPNPYAFYESGGTMRIAQSKIEWDFNNYRLHELITPLSYQFSEEEVIEKKQFEHKVEDGVIYDEGVNLLVMDQAKIDAIKALPESSILECAISFGGYNDITIIDQLREEYPQSKFIWAAVNNEYGISYGIPLVNTYYWGSLDKVYPGLNAKAKTAKEYEKYYQATLAMYKDNMDYYMMLYQLYNPLDNEQEAKKALDRKIEEAEKGVPIIGVRSYMRKNDLLKMIEANQVEGLLVLDVKLSEFEK